MTFESCFILEIDVQCLSEYLAIDETLYPMKHQIAFRQYNPNKPHKYGVLLKSLNEARVPYTFKSVCTICCKTDLWWWTILHQLNHRLCKISCSSNKKASQFAWKKHFYRSSVYKHWMCQLTSWSKYYNCGYSSKRKAGHPRWIIWYYQSWDLP